MATVREQLAEIVALLDQGYAVVFGSTPDADGKDEAYTIQCIGNRDGHALKTATPVEHKTFGVFGAYVPGGSDRKSQIIFDGGSWMRKVEGTDDDQPGFYLSWSTVKATPEQLAYMGYDFDVPKRYIAGLLAGLGG